MDNPFNQFSQFNPFLFLNNSSSQFDNPFNPFQANTGLGSFQNPWMQNNSYSSSNSFAEMQKKWAETLMSGASNQFSPNEFMGNTNQMVNNSFLPWVNLSQDFFSKLQNWQKDIGQISSFQWQQNLMNVMLDSSKQGTSNLSKQMGNILSDWKKYDLGKFINNHLFNELQVAISAGDTDAQKKALEKICKQWYEYSKNLQRLDVISFYEKTWVVKNYKKIIDESLATFEKIQSKHFDNVDQENLKNYLAKLSSLFDGFINLVEKFSNFDEELSKSFIESALSKEINIKDITDLFNLWCAKFDDCYNQRVLTSQYQEAFSKWVNSISDFKIAMQKIIDRCVEQVGLPSNREMNTVHKRLHQTFKDCANLKKQVEQLNKKIDALEKNTPKAASVQTKKTK